MKLYLVMVIRKPGFDPAVVPAHQQFLDELRDRQRIERAGPFGDRTGGAYLLRAVDMDEARSIVERDPAPRSGGWHASVYEWQAH